MSQTATRERIVAEDAGTLEQVHRAFQSVVETLVRDEGLYGSQIPLQRRGEEHSSRVRVERYAECSVRNGGENMDLMKRGTFATYMHSDAWFESEPESESPPPPPLAMVNVWMALNDEPPSNTLCFHETTAASTVRTHMLHADFAWLEGGLCVYDGGMRWGRCYVFVSGQRDTCEEVLLHGAIDVPPPPELLGGNEESPSLPAPPRRISLECRFTVHCDE